MGQCCQEQLPEPGLIGEEAPDWSADPLGRLGPVAWSLDQGSASHVNDVRNAVVVIWREMKRLELRCVMSRVAAVHERALNDLIQRQVRSPGQNNHTLNVCDPPALRVVQSYAPAPGSLGAVCGVFHAANPRTQSGPASWRPPFQP
jgi:hypothetical protein